ncbi:3-isopropylmalate dehydratase large subunit [Aliidongia dinghuensis]|uniref:3-isopropylmalate dehydratase n=1 Tax=Aliidongia dinghuensis TaxID=1867774 RepID=A0A8J3E7V5_9PROT|nr:3-isopropylmalate dehydratase large subunit [Aliidongia dinghuensis]GGF50731.1 3-isopropylmalate dehydratase large subunit [Aliidongia dinghuensis]
MDTVAGQPRTLFDKLWDKHVVHQRDDGHTLIYIDRHYLGDDLPRDTFDVLARRGLRVRRPDATFAMADHYASTRGCSINDIIDADRRELVEKLIDFSRAQGVSMFALDAPQHGIVHVTGPEQGLTLPGMTVVCGDSHTSTHGALGAFGFGIGSSEVSHVLATQTLWQKRPATMLARFAGTPAFGVTAKDIALAMIARIGVSGGAGHVIEYAGDAIDALSVEARMTLCNLSIEAGARAGMIAPDEKTYAYLQGRHFAPQGPAWAAAIAEWRALRSDPGARFSREVLLDTARVAPMVTWGTNPSQSAPIDGRVSDVLDLDDPAQRTRLRDALDYMDIRDGQQLEGLPVDRVFIGSCTNGRLEDLRVAAAIFDGRRVKVPTMIVPGSRTVRNAATAEGLDRIFLAAGAEWREPGCSMCLAINGDEGRPGERIASTTNRNFVGRQGRGVRTHLMSPGMAAAAAIAGRLVDYRELLRHAAADAT